jgi:CrcB protein
MIGTLSLAQLGLVGIAGATGALLRYLVGLGITRRVKTSLPLATWLINLSGAFVIGLIAGLVGRQMLTPAAQLVLATGFLGGYTTFSTMQWEGTQLVRGGSLVWGLLYLGSTFALGVPLAALGLLVGGWR